MLPILRGEPARHDERWIRQTIPAVAFGPALPTPPRRNGTHAREPLLCQARGAAREVHRVARGSPSPLQGGMRTMGDPFEDTHGMNRREFLKAAGATGLGLAAGSILLPRHLWSAYAAPAGGTPRRGGKVPFGSAGRPASIEQHLA